MAELITSIYLNDIKNIKEALENGADVYFQDEQSGMSPLHVAILQNNRDIVELLLEKGADVNLQNNSGDTPLHFAIAGENVELCNLLLNAGADVNLQNENGKTPLHHAVEN